MSKEILIALDIGNKVLDSVFNNMSDEEKEEYEFIERTWKKLESYGFDINDFDIETWDCMLDQIEQEMGGK